MKNKVKINKVVEINPNIPKTLFQNPTQKVSFLPMAGVSEDGTLSFVEERTLSEVYKGYRYFERGDVLIAKITPCFENGKAVFVENLPCSVGFGSTEFHVLRPSTDIDPKYLFYLIWNPIFRFIGKLNMTGTAGQKRLPTEFIKRYKIPCPTIKEQKRIAIILDKADAIRHKRKRTTLLADEFLRSVFLAMFGNPVTNKKGWNKHPVYSFCKIVRGSSPRPKGDSRYYGGNIPRLMVEDITRDGFFVQPQIDSLTEEGAKLSRPVPKGTLVMVVSGKVGVMARLKCNACIHDGFVAFLNVDNKKVFENFLMFSLDLLRKTHASREAGAIFKNLTTTQIKEMEIPLPPKSLQHRFNKIFNKLYASQERFLYNYREADRLFSSIAQKAFRGDL